MHELSVCMAIVAQVERISRQHAARVSSITLKIGPLSGVEPMLLERAYPLAAAGTPLAAARLIIAQLPIRLHCRGCGAETIGAPNHMVCASCGDWHTDLLSGDEMLLASVELERVTSTSAALQ
jgi:hydrogenase nickel incorporation protein HypA/HybF